MLMLMYLIQGTVDASICLRLPCKVDATAQCYLDTLRAAAGTPCDPNTASQVSSSNGNNLQMDHSLPNIFSTEMVMI